MRCRRSSVARRRVWRQGSGGSTTWSMSWHARGRNWTAQRLPGRQRSSERLQRRSGRRQRRSAARASWQRLGRSWQLHSRRRHGSGSLHSGCRRRATLWVPRAPGVSRRCKPSCTPLVASWQSGRGRCRRPWLVSRMRRSSCGSYPPPWHLCTASMMRRWTCSRSSTRASCKLQQRTAQQPWQRRARSGMSCSSGWPQRRPNSAAPCRFGEAQPGFLLLLGCVEAACYVERFHTHLLLQEAARESGEMRHDLEALAADGVELRRALQDSEARRQVGAPEGGSRAWEVGPGPEAGRQEEAARAAWLQTKCPSIHVHSGG